MKKKNNLMTTMSLENAEILQKSIQFKLGWLDNPKSEISLTDYEKENKETLKGSLVEIESYLSNKIEEAKRQKLKLSFAIDTFLKSVEGSINDYYDYIILPQKLKAHRLPKKEGNNAIKVFKMVKKLERELYKKYTKIVEYNDNLEKYGTEEEWIIKDGKVVTND